MPNKSSASRRDCLRVPNIKCLTMTRVTQLPGRARVVSLSNNEVRHISEYRFRGRFDTAQKYFPNCPFFLHAKYVSQSVLLRETYGFVHALVASRGPSCEVLPPAANWEVP